jgi:hypothetical protein
MKNIHLIPTYKPSRLHFDEVLFSSPNFQLSKTINSDVEGRNLYITSDEEIKEGDWFLHPFNTIHKAGGNLIDKDFKKIILTTDKSLINEGIQSIDDEFLQWYINNPGCEVVLVRDKPKVKAVVKGLGIKSFDNGYKIILPKKETKLKNICIKCGVDLYATEGRFTCQQSECRGIIVSKETLQEWADEEERKRHLIEIMKGDEELGLYDMVQHKPTQETKLTFIEWIGLFRWMGKTS